MSSLTISSQSLNSIAGVALSTESLSCDKAARLQDLRACNRLRRDWDFTFSPESAWLCIPAEASV